MVTYLVYEPDCSGHHLAYLNLTVSSLSAAGHKILLGTTPTTLNEIRKISPKILRSVSEIIAIPYSSENNNVKGKWGFLVRQFESFRHLRSSAELARKHGATRIFVCFVDSIFLLLSIVGFKRRGLSISGIMMRTSFYQAKAGIVGAKPKFSERFKSVLFRRLILSDEVLRLFVLDPTAAEVFKNSPLEGKVRFLPDPASTMALPLKAEAVQQLKIKAGTSPIVLCYGAITCRKRVRFLLDAANAINFGITLIVGECDDEIRALLASEPYRGLLASGRVVLLDRFVSSEEENLAFAAADAVWLNYENHLHMSGVMVKAALCDKPIIACSEGLIGWYARQGAGFVVGGNVQLMGEVISKIARNDPEVAESVAKARQIFEGHTPAAFESIIAASC